MLHPLLPLFPIPQARRHGQFQRFIVWRSCYSTPLSSLWLWLQGGRLFPVPSVAPQCPWSWRLQELQQSENWHLRNPGWGRTLLLCRAWLWSGPAGLGHSTSGILKTWFKNATDSGL